MSHLYERRERDAERDAERERKQAAIDHSRELFNHFVALDKIPREERALKLENLKQLQKIAKQNLDDFKNDSMKAVFEEADIKVREQERINDSFDEFHMKLETKYYESMDNAV
jgi:hypothetical protein